MPTPEAREPRVWMLLTRQIRRLRGQLMEKHWSAHTGLVCFWSAALKRASPARKCTPRSPALRRRSALRNLRRQREDGRSTGHVPGRRVGRCESSATRQRRVAVAREKRRKRGRKSYSVTKVTGHLPERHAEPRRRPLAGLGDAAAGARCRGEGRGRGRLCGGGGAVGAFAVRLQRRRRLLRLWL